MVSRLFELMFEGSFTGVPRMYQGSFKGVLRKIEGYLRDISVSFKVI